MVDADDTDGPRNKPESFIHVDYVTTCTVYYIPSAVFTCFTVCI